MKPKVAVLLIDTTERIFVFVIWLNCPFTFPLLLMLHVQLEKNKKTKTFCMLLTLFPPLTDCCLPVCPPALLSPSRLPGAVFDRQASIRRSLINTDTVSRRPKKVKRRKTISGLPDNFNQELGMDHCGAKCCPLLSTDLYQHSGQASLHFHHFIPS